MPLINDLPDFLEYVIVDSNINEKKLLVFSKHAEFRIKKLIGTKQYEDFETMTAEDPVKELLRTFIAQFGLLLAMPSIRLRISNAGIFTSETKNTKDPDWWQVRDLHRSLRDIAFSSLDSALQMMETDPNKYPNFVQSENYTVIKEVIVTNAGTFNKYFNIQDSRMTYLGLLPYLRECIDEYLQWLGGCLNDIPDNEFGKKLTEYLQKALVALTVAKVAETGSFSFSDNTLIVKWEQLPWEKSEKVTDTQLSNLKESRINAGLNYLSQAKNFIKENLAEFPCFENPEPKNDPQIYLRKSGIYLS